MSLDSKHPLYSRHLADWELMRDCYLGERQVKEKGQVYLPATSGMHADGMIVNQPGWLAYQAYKTRAVFHDFVREAVETLIGVMHNKPADIQLPPRLESMRDRGTVKGESLLTLLRRVNEAQLTTGRLGMLLDIPETMPAGTAPTPYIATYQAEDIYNWDDGRRDDSTIQTLNFVCLNESEDEREQDFVWRFVHKHRVLMLGDGSSLQPSGSYHWGVFRESNGFTTAAMRVAQILGRELGEIPFTICNSKDIVSEPDSPPLLGLARLCMTIYRGEADYRQALFMQGQDTLVTIGMNLPEDQTLRVGTGGRIDLPSGQGNDAKYIGVGGEGLSEMREALENDKKMAAAKGGQLLDTSSRQKESGDALKTRVSAQTATLNQIALAGAYALQTQLRMAARWVGADESKVIVNPNLDFDDTVLTGQDLLQYVSAKNMGAPISRKTIHAIMRKKEVTELTYEEEMEEIETEKPMGPTVTLPVDPNGDDPEDEEDKAPAED